MKYHTIVADPPWDVLAGPPWSSNQKSQPLVYPTMSIDEIKALDVGAWAEDDCQLYLWTINKYLKQAFEIAESWGFKFSTLLTWVKKPHGIGLGGAYVQTCEYVLFCHKGRVDHQTRIDTTWWLCKRRKHSEKPSEMLDIFEAVGKSPYLELFARQRREGWDVWGNEVDSDIELKVREAKGVL